MSNRVKPGARARAAEPVVDHGAAPWRADVEVCDAADPDAPNRTVRRAQRVPCYDRWQRSGLITDAQREAADRYARRAEEASGACWQPDGPPGHVAHWARAHATERQSAALRDLAAVERALGPMAAAIVWTVAVEGASARQLARVLGWRGGSGEARAMAAARDALDVAARHWGME